MKKIILTILLVLSLTSISHGAGFRLEFQNPKNTKMAFEVYWINHPFTDIKTPFEMGEGELLPREIFTFSKKYPNRTKWIVRWINSKKPHIMFFKVPAGISKVIIKYKKIILERGI